MRAKAQYSGILYHGLKAVAIKTSVIMLAQYGGENSIRKESGF